MITLKQTKNVVSVSCSLFLSISILFSGMSVQATGAIDTDCEDEIKLIHALEKQIKKAESEITWLNTEDYTSAGNALVASTYLAIGTYLTFIEKNYQAATVSSGLTAAALGSEVYNFKIRKSLKSEYAKLIKNSKGILNSMITQIENNNCTKTVTKPLSKLSQSELTLARIVQARMNLSQAAEEISSELGNVGYKTSTVVSISLGSAVLATALANPYFSKMGRFSALQTSIIVASPIATANQGINTMSLGISKLEAVKLLEAFNHATQELLTQENALHAAIRAQKLISK